MALGLGVLRLPPSSFWAMTPRELQAAADGLYGPRHQEGPVDRLSLAGMMARFPDHADISPLTGSH